MCTVCDIAVATSDGVTTRGVVSCSAVAVAVSPAVTERLRSYRTTNDKFQSLKQTHTTKSIGRLTPHLADFFFFCWLSNFATSPTRTAVP